MAVFSYTDYFFPGYLVLGIFVGLVITVISVLIYISINATSQSEGEFRIVRIDYGSSISSENLNKLKEACKYFFNVARFYERTSVNELYIITQGEFKYITRDPFTREILPATAGRDPPTRWGVTSGSIQSSVRASGLGISGSTVEFSNPY